MSARVACHMQHSNCGRHTDNWTIADSFISVFPGGHSPASQRRNSSSIPDIHMRFAVYRMSLGQHFFTRFRSTRTQCSSERYSAKILGQRINRRFLKKLYPSSRKSYTAILSGLPPIEIREDCEGFNKRYKTSTSPFDLYTKNNLAVQPNRKN
jgi:hypothetical protein